MLSYNVSDFKRTTHTIFYRKWYVGADIVFSFIGSLNLKFEFIERWWDKVRYHTYVHTFREEFPSNKFRFVVIFQNRVPHRWIDAFIYDKVCKDKPYGVLDISDRYGSNRNDNSKEYKGAKECLASKKNVFAVDAINKNDKWFLKVKDVCNKKTFDYEVPSYLQPKKNDQP